ncbi:MAG: hypothetical protein JSV89_15240 [Spirochaetaceae bacterium]|nr:MAG: hypothetical protein JSV89_15240 [Spirochaetaceae bacterium]
MSLFAILGIPCLTIVFLFTDGGREILRKREAPALEFIKGFLFAVPCLVAVLLVHRYAPLSYRSLPLYLLFLVTDHLIPVVFLGILYLLVYSQKTYGGLLCFGGGFYTLLSIVEIFVHYGQYEPYHLFLLPGMRMAGLLFLTIFFLRYQEWYGLVRALYLVLLILIPFLSAAITYLYMRSYLIWAVFATALFFLGSMFYTHVELKD